MSTDKKARLGRGFDSLIPQNFDRTIIAEVASGQEKIIKINVKDLMANPDQPRLIFDESELDGLATSIKSHGVLQPLVVTPNAEKYYIIAGERRWRAAKSAGLEVVPAVVRTVEQLERLELALVENVQRVNLSPLEQAMSIQYLRDQFSLDFKVIGERLGKAATTVQNTARLLLLPEVAQAALRARQITEGHARSILALKEEKEQLELLKLILKHSWSVRQAERYVVAHREGATNAVAAKKKVSTRTPKTDKLSRVLNTKVSVRRTAKGGKLEITFKSDDDLDRILLYISKNKN
ncbi:ParB/RepB/Spo0J family partition protein [Candidatus Saccharibacteria bacterium]|nr:ParB/RepB/Spo0J family partition protein [Candidatus Saccharibacteria bacterium]